MSRTSSPELSSVSRHTGAGEQALSGCGAPRDSGQDCLDSGAVGRTPLAEDSAARGPGPRWDLFLPGVQFLHVPLDPQHLGVSTELLALPGGEYDAFSETDALAGELVSHHSALRKLLGNEGPAARRRNRHGTCRKCVAGTQDQEQEAGSKAAESRHVFEGAGGSARL